MVFFKSIKRTNNVFIGWKPSKMLLILAREWEVEDVDMKITGPINSEEKGIRDVKILIQIKRLSFFFKSDEEKNKKDTGQCLRRK